MSKRHFIAIASVIAAYSDPDTFGPTPRHIAEDLADFFKRENPRFDRARFLEACGVEDED